MASLPGMVRIWRLVIVCLAAMLLVPLSARSAEASRGDLGPGAQGTEVAALQSMLAAQGFYRGPINGVYGTVLSTAVVAFHKEIGVSRSAAWRSQDWDLLATYQSPWLPARTGEPDRLEINITSQVLYLIQDDLLRAVIPISSGNGELFYNAFGDLTKAHTPRGDFSLQWHVNGWRTSYLGELYRPWYFVGGYAVHGSTSVPTYPASHGCVRVPMWEADFLEGQLFLGMPVHVWDLPSGAGPVFGDIPNAQAFQGPFVDDEGSVHEEAIGQLFASGITQGCDDYFFCPDDPVTRGQMAAFLVRTFGLPPGPDVFGDDDGTLFEADINALAAAEITTGCEEGRFCPDRTVTRGEMAAFLVRALELPAASQDHFSDDAGSIFEQDINALAAAGITQGCGDDLFCPWDRVTRAEMASFLVRASG
ncbi:MAG: S-layer homology domain-containing protein [Acidimicrobiia bacterium]